MNFNFNWSPTFQGSCLSDISLCGSGECYGGTALISPEREKDGYREIPSQKAKIVEGMGK